MKIPPRQLTAPKPVIVAVIGHGVDADHPDLKDSIVDGVSFTDSPWDVDLTGKGTHVAGIIAGRTWPGDYGKETVEPLTLEPTPSGTASGTGLAAPVVAGAAAVIQASDPTLTPEEVKGKLIADAEEFGFLVSELGKIDR